LTEPYLGEIRIFPTAYKQQGWVPCDGSLLPVNTNQALFSLLGKQFGGDGTTNFALPDLRGRVIVGTGVTPSGTTYNTGVAGGAETVALTASNMPGHTHPVVASSANAAASTATAAPKSNFLAAAIQATSASAVAVPVPLYAPGANPVSLAPGVVSSIGSGGAHDNMQPSIALEYRIRVSAAVYPPRP
jgi:microcystin-dependent protein